MSRTALLEPPYADQAGAPPARMMPGDVHRHRQPRPHVRERPALFALDGARSTADTHALACAVEIPARAAVRAATRQVLAEAGLTAGHLALIDPSDFTEAPDDHTGEALLAVAAGAGTTRLIDTIPLTFGGPQ